jgi:hypothetical protein
MKNIHINVLTFYFLISPSFVHSVSDTIKQITIKIGRLGDLDALIPPIRREITYVKTKPKEYQRYLYDIRSLPLYENAWYGIPNPTDYSMSALSSNETRSIIDQYLYFYYYRIHRLF